MTIKFVREAMCYTSLGNATHYPFMICLLSVLALQHLTRIITIGDLRYKDNVDDKKCCF